MIYHITGYVTYAFDEFVEANSAEEAEAEIEYRADYGRLANMGVNDFYLEDIEEIEIVEE